MGIREILTKVSERLGFGMRAKLIALFIAIKVVPLLLLALLAWRQAWSLGEEFKIRTNQLASMANASLAETGQIAINDAVEALDERAREDIESLSTDTAMVVADFLYERDSDILYLANIAPDRNAYNSFIESRKRLLMQAGKWELSSDDIWVPANRTPQAFDEVSSSNRDNDESFHYVPPTGFQRHLKPLYHEITFVDLNGMERVKVTTSPLMSPVLKDISKRENTFIKAENYFQELKSLKPGEIYVSDVIGAYVGSKIIGTYNRANAVKAGIEYDPTNSAYAGKENPVGKRFQGIVRWAAPVSRGGRIIGYVTMALNHDHIMEFTDRITPTVARYNEIPDASEGNYAFIWDYNGRSIVHPRHFSIAGYDPETGDPQVPWLEDWIYNDWQASGKSYAEFIKDVPIYYQQSNSKKAAPELTKAGLVGLDCRYLNFAAQCTGWADLTRDGGSGSFLILWSGLWKLNTAATIPYYTGKYGDSRRGFGFVAIGAGVDEFHKPANATKAVLDKLIVNRDRDMRIAADSTYQSINRNLIQTGSTLLISTSVMIILVIFIAIWIASIFTDSISNMIKGIGRFRTGEHQFRFNTTSTDEMGELADSFDDMANSIVATVKESMAIVDMDRKVIYMNEQGLALVGRTLEEVVGQPYSENTTFPSGTEYDGIESLLNGRESEVFFHEKTGRYYKSTAHYYKNRAGETVGYQVMGNDVTGLIETQKELEAAVRDANKANVAKSEFLARMSHEIRTPMNAIIGMAQVTKMRLKEGAATESIEPHLEQIGVSSRHLLGLLNDILDISKIEAGKIDITNDSFNLRSMMAEVNAIIKPRCDEKNIEYVINLDRLKHVDYISDALRLKQVFINLLGNAVKFTPEQGYIELKARCVEDEEHRAKFAFSIKDNGIGIADDVKDKLFTPFEQGGHAVTALYGGTGLGLSISQQIVELLGSKIELKSQMGVGSEFYFSLWLDKADAVLTDSSQQEVIFSAKSRILLVDDNMVNRMVVCEQLKSTTTNVDEAEDGQEAVNIFSMSRLGEYGIIFMDIQMPDVDGYEATRMIRAMDREDAKTVPIIALSANAFTEDVSKSIASGMNSHLVKPLEYDKLMEVMLKYFPHG
ncbi:MAG: response regulator [Deferribacteraceae bacterium]|jgi:PAS domain S-box-containing protein|nr:response regulator [Deferribacteraceae bacterium]